MNQSDWDKVLDNYGFPDRPCDTKCFDGCPGRPSCPLYGMWRSKINKIWKNNKKKG